MVMEDSDVVFERVLHSVGDEGPFQRRFNILFNFLLSALGTMTYMNLILVMVVPDFWCYVPGRNETNFTIDVWKELTLPRENNSFGKETFSSCQMYKVIDSSQNNVSFEDETVECQYGYEYDTTWYDSTLLSTQNWVCDKILYSANIIAAAKLGEVFGCLVMGYIGDWLGRRPVFYISLVLTLISRLITPFVADYYYVLIVMAIIATFPSMSVTQSCMVTLMEISPAEDRAFLAQMQNVGWTVGLSALPLIYWLLKDWFIFMLVTTLPLAVYLFLSIFMIESPRWLLSRGRVTECLQQLNIIAKVNGTTLSPNSSQLLQNSVSIPEKVYGAGSLFSSLRLAKNTTLLLLAWMSCFLNYNTVVLNVSNMSGNPYLNFFFQSIAEAPPYFFGKILCDKIGRRFTGMIGFLVGITAYTILVVTINDEGKQWIHVSMLVLAKFSISMIYLVISLQSLEIYPTSVRQSGFSLGLTLGNVFGTLSPYVVYSGKVVDSRLPFGILAIASIIGVIAELLLPETVNEHLPETLNEAKKFGADQSYFSLPGKKRDLYILANVKYIKRHHSENNEVEPTTPIEK